MVGDAEAHAAEDAKFRELAETRNQADSLIHATEKSLRELGDKVSGEERAKIEAALADVKEAVKSDNKAVIETKLRALGEASSGMAQRLYANEQANQQGAGGGAPGDTPEGGGNDNVVDAEFEEVKDDKNKNS